MNTKIEIGNRIKKTREELGLKKVEVARALDVSHQSVQQWESGQTTPRGARMDRLASLFSVPVEFLAFGKSDDTNIESISKPVTSEELQSFVSTAFTKTLLEISDIGWISIKEGVETKMLSDIMVRNLQKSMEKN